MHLEQHGARGLEQRIVRAAVNVPLLDPQCEDRDSRAAWIARMAEQAGVVDRVLEGIRSTIEAGGWRADTWDGEYQAAVLAALAVGRAEARALLRRGFEDSGEQQAGASALVRLEGAGGLEHVARILGARMRAQPGLLSIFGPDEAPLFQLDEQEGAGAGRRLLQELAGRDADVAAYLAAVGTFELASEAGPRVRVLPDLEALLEQVAAGGRGLQLRTWGRHAAASERLHLFERAHLEPDPLRRAALLRAFHPVGPPFVSQRLLGWAADPCEELAWSSVQTLAHVRDPRVRTLALERLSGARPWWPALLLLRSNRRAGDARWIHLALDRAPELKDRHELHSVLYDLLNVCEAGATVDVDGLLARCFVDSSCASCRHSALARLLELGRAPDWMLEEAGLDGDEAVRELAHPDQGSM